MSLPICEPPLDFKRAPILDDRFDFLASLAREGRVLDLGCIDERHPERIATSLHARLREANPRVVGADLDGRAIEVVRGLGFEVLAGDAQCSDLGGPYDLVIAAELIEHLDDPGRALDNIARHLAPKGKLALTTPNPFYVNQWAKILKYGQPQVHAEHRTWFCPQTLTVLLHARGFELEDFAWLGAGKGLVRRSLARWRPYWSAGFALTAVRRARD